MTTNPITTIYLAASSTSLFGDLSPIQELILFVFAAVGAIFLGQKFGEWVKSKMN